MPAPAIPLKVPTTLATEYKEKVVPALIESRGYKNVMEVPKISKVVVNCCIGSSVDTKVALEDAFNEIQMITGQKPIKTKSTKSIANFKLRENQEIGVKDQTIFPEVELDKVKRNLGMDITIVTTARKNEEAKELLALFGMPFSDRKLTPQ